MIPQKTGFSKPQLFSGISIDVAEVYSMLVWVNFAEITGERHQFFFDKGADDKAPGGWRLGKLMSGDIRFQIYKDGAWQPANDLMKPNFETDRWYHAAVTRDKSGTTKIYLDGEAGVSVDIESYILPINEDSLMIWGSTLWGTNNMFTGTIDELAIFKDRALTKSEINSFMQSGQTAVEHNGKLSGKWGEIKGLK